MNKNINYFFITLRKRNLFFLYYQKNCCFNKIHYRLILNEKIPLNDLVFIDKSLYNSLKIIIEMKKKAVLSILEIYFHFNV